MAIETNSAKVTRRQVLAAGAAGAVASAGCGRLGRMALGPAEALSVPPSFGDPDAVLLNRIGFGPSPRQLADLKRLGREAYVDLQLKGTQEEPLELTFRLSRLDVLRLGEADLHDIPEERVLEQLQQAAILRAVHSPNQLLERMADFWTNHFNIYARKGLSAWRKPGEELNVIRKHALGSFGDLLRATAHSPAMLAYLDNQVNRKGIPNENYARELMELHTLGVHGGYTQDDVREVARCFTGWSLESRFLRPRGRFRFIAENHDEGEKRVLGHCIPPKGGQEDGETVLTILATHPATARFIGSKLARYFLGPEPGPWPKRLAEIFLQTGGNVKAMLRPMLLSEEMRHPAPLFKRPLDFVASCLRAFDTSIDGGSGVQSHLETMGQPLFQWPMPDGYPDATAAWTGSMLARWNFAAALAHGEVPGVDLDWSRLPGTTLRERIDSVAKLVLPHVEQPPEEALMACRTEREAVEICLASPAFQWR